MKGIIVKNLNGKERSFHFGNEMLLLLEDEGISLNNLSEMVRSKMATTINKVLYNAALAHLRLERKEQDFDRIDVSKWVDELGGLTETLNMITEGLKVHEIKNTEALQEQG